MEIDDIWTRMAMQSRIKFNKYKKSIFNSNKSSQMQTNLMVYIKFSLFFCIISFNIIIIYFLLNTNKILQVNGKNLKKKKKN